MSRNSSKSEDELYGVPSTDGGGHTGPTISQEPEPNNGIPEDQPENIFGKQVKILDEALLYLKDTADGILNEVQSHPTAQGLEANNPETRQRIRLDLSGFIRLNIWLSASIDLLRQGIWLDEANSGPKEDLGGMGYEGDGNDDADDEKPVLQDDLNKEVFFSCNKGYSELVKEAESLLTVPGNSAEESTAVSRIKCLKEEKYRFRVWMSNTRIDEGALSILVNHHLYKKTGEVLESILVDLVMLCEACFINESSFVGSSSHSQIRISLTQWLEETKRLLAVLPEKSGKTDNYLSSYMATTTPEVELLTEGENEREQNVPEQDLPYELSSQDHLVGLLTMGENEREQNVPGQDLPHEVPSQYRLVRYSSSTTPGNASRQQDREQVFELQHHEPSALAHSHSASRGPGYPGCVPKSRSASSLSTTSSASFEITVDERPLPECLLDSLKDSNKILFPLVRSLEMAKANLGEGTHSQIYQAIREITASPNSQHIEVPASPPPPPPPPRPRPPPPSVTSISPSHAYSPEPSPSPEPPPRRYFPLMLMPPPSHPSESPTLSSAPPPPLPMQKSPLPPPIIPTPSPPPIPMLPPPPAPYPLVVPSSIPSPSMAPPPPAPAPAPAPAPHPSSVPDPSMATLPSAPHPSPIPFPMARRPPRPHLSPAPDSPMTPTTPPLHTHRAPDPSMAPSSPLYHRYKAKTTYDPLQHQEQSNVLEYGLPDGLPDGLPGEDNFKQFVQREEFVISSSESSNYSLNHMGPGTPKVHFEPTVSNKIFLWDEIRSAALTEPKNLHRLLPRLEDLGFGLYCERHAPMLDNLGLDKWVFFEVIKCMWKQESQHMKTSFGKKAKELLSKSETDLRPQQLDNHPSIQQRNRNSAPQGPPEGSGQPHTFSGQYYTTFYPDVTTGNSVRDESQRTLYRPPSHSHSMQKQNDQGQNDWEKRLLPPAPPRPRYMWQTEDHLAQAPGYLHHPADPLRSGQNERMRPDALIGAAQPTTYDEDIYYEDQGHNHTRDDNTSSYSRQTKYSSEGHQRDQGHNPTRDDNTSSYSRQTKNSSEGHQRERSRFRGEKNMVDFSQPIETLSRVNRRRRNPGANTVEVQIQV